MKSSIFEPCYDSDVMYVYDADSNVCETGAITVPLTHTAKRDFYAILDVVRDKGTNLVVTLTNPLISRFISNIEGISYPILTALFHNLCNIKNPNNDKKAFAGFSCRFETSSSPVYPEIPLYKGLTALKVIASLIGDCSCFKDIFLVASNDKTDAILRVPIDIFFYMGNIEEIYEKLETIGWKDATIKTKEEQPCVDQHESHFPALDFHQIPKTFKDIAQHQIAVYESKNADYGRATGKLYEKYGMSYYMIMLEQKMLRIENLLNKDSKANNESIEDSLLDLSNYAILAVESLRNEKLCNEKEEAGKE